MATTSSVTDPEPETREGIAEKTLKRNLSHLLISASKDIGPEFTLGETVLHFKPKAPVTAMAVLIGEDNRILGLQGYITLCLIEADREDFGRLQDDIDLEGLNEIINNLSEAYTSLPTE